nr:MAG TPA: hypothetical protein [Caudoviricetes sp.]
MVIILFSLASENKNLSYSLFFSTLDKETKNLKKSDIFILAISKFAFLPLNIRYAA